MHLLHHKLLNSALLWFSIKRPECYIFWPIQHKHILHNGQAFSKAYQSVIELLSYVIVVCQCSAGFSNHSALTAALPRNVPATLTTINTDMVFIVMDYLT